MKNRIKGGEKAKMQKFKNQVAKKNRIITKEISTEAEILPCISS